MTMAASDTDEQMMLIELPSCAPAPDKMERPARSARPRSARAVPATDPACPIASTGSDIVLVDPRSVAVDPVNARHGLVFDATAQAELITSMRIVGNTVPVRLRRNPAGGAKLLCPSGSQRLAAALHILAEQPTFRLRAIIAEEMSDQEAFVIGEADNAGRTGVAPMQQARKWTEALETVYGGDRQAFIAATGRTASVVSRTLALAALPEYVLACCSDIEALTPWFAEQLTPRLADPDQEAEVRRRAEALTAAGRRLPGAKLIRLLLEDAASVSREPQIVWQSADGARAVRYRAAGKGGRIDLTSPATLSAAERRNVVKALDTLLKQLAAIALPR